MLQQHRAEERRRRACVCAEPCEQRLLKPVEHAPAQWQPARDERQVEVQVGEVQVSRPVRGHRKVDGRNRRVGHEDVRGAEIAVRGLRPPFFRCQIGVVPVEQGQRRDPVVIGECAPCAVDRTTETILEIRAIVLRIRRLSRIGT